jgi:predicted hydrocarbon binding protein
MFRPSPEWVQYLESFKRFGVRPFRELAPLRPRLGDRISILIRQDLEFSILALSPKVYTPYIYSWGKFVGKHVAEQAMATLKVSLATKLAAKIFKMALLRTDVYQDAVARGWIENLSAIPTFTYFDERAGVFRVKTEECDEASGLPNIGRKVCFYEGAAIAGNTESALGRVVNVFETKCIAYGHPYCEFMAEIDSPFPRKFALLSKRDFVKIRKSILDRMLAAPRTKLTRPELGDFSHLAQFQALYLGIWLSSPGAHTMLYWLGKKTGEEIGKRIRERTMTAQLKQFAKFMRNLKIGLLSFERDRAKFRFAVEECVFCTGAANFRKKICSYLAGALAGFLTASLGKITTIVERTCVADGDERCEFETI